MAAGANQPQVNQPGAVYAAPAQPQRAPVPNPQPQVQPVPGNGGVASQGGGAPRPQVAAPVARPQPAPQQRVPVPNNGNVASQRAPVAQPQAMQAQRPVQAGNNLPKMDSGPTVQVSTGHKVAQPAPAGALQYENIARQIGERLKVQVNESIDKLVVQLAKDLKNNIPGISNPGAIAKNMQSPFSGSAQGNAANKKEGAIAKWRVARQAKKASKQAQPPKANKPGFFSRFSKKKGAQELPPPAQQNFQQPLYPPPIQGHQLSSRQSAPQQAYPKPQPQRQQAYPQQRPQPQQRSPQQQPMAPGQLPQQPPRR